MPHQVLSWPCGVSGSLEFENHFDKAGGQNQLLEMSLTPLTVAHQPHSLLEGARTEPGLSPGETRQKWGPPGASQR